MLEFNIPEDIVEELTSHISSEMRKALEDWQKRMHGSMREIDGDAESVLDNTHLVMKIIPCNKWGVPLSEPSKPIKFNIVQRVPHFGKEESDGGN